MTETLDKSETPSMLSLEMGVRVGNDVAAAAAWSWSRVTRIPTAQDSPITLNYATPRVSSGSRRRAQSWFFRVTPPSRQSARRMRLMSEMPHGVPRLRTSVIIARTVVINPCCRECCVSATEEPATREEEAVWAGIGRRRSNHGVSNSLNLCHFNRYFFIWSIHMD